VGTKTLTYDLNGNLIKDGNGSITYTWDAIVCRAPTGPPPSMLPCIMGCAGIMGGVTTVSAAEGSGGLSGSPSMDDPARV